MKRRTASPPNPRGVNGILAVGDVDTRHYLEAILDTSARVNEINNLTWPEVNLDDCCLTHPEETGRDSDATQDPHDRMDAGDL